MQWGKIAPVGLLALTNISEKASGRNAPSNPPESRNGREGLSFLACSRHRCRSPIKKPRLSHDGRGPVRGGRERGLTLSRASVIETIASWELSGNLWPPQWAIVLRDERYPQKHLLNTTLFTKHAHIRQILASCDISALDGSQ